MTEKLESNPFCFVCGQENPRGLKAKIAKQADGCSISITLENTLEGYRGIIHGGILVSLMDEVMAYAVSNDNLWGVTASLEVKFKKKVSSEKQIIVTGKVIERKGSWAKAYAQIKYENDEEILAEANGLFKVLPLKQ